MGYINHGKGIQESSNAGEPTQKYQKHRKEILSIELLSHLPSKGNDDLVAHIVYQTQYKDTQIIIILILFVMLQKCDFLLHFNFKFIPPISPPHLNSSNPLVTFVQG